MIIAANPKTDISGMSKSEIETYVRKTEARVIKRPCTVCGRKKNVVAKMFTSGDRFLFLPVCYRCLETHLDFIKEFLMDYWNTNPNNPKESRCSKNGFSQVPGWSEQGSIPG